MLVGSAANFVKWEEEQRGIRGKNGDSKRQQISRLYSRIGFIAIGNHLIEYRLSVVHISSIAGEFQHMIVMLSSEFMRIHGIGRMQLVPNAFHNFGNIRIGAVK